MSCSSITVVIFFWFVINSSLIFLHCEAPENGSTDDLMVCSFSVELHCTHLLCTINKLLLCCSITENEKFIIIIVIKIIEA